MNKKSSSIVNLQKIASDSTYSKHKPDDPSMNPNNYSKSRYGKPPPPDLSDKIFTNKKSFSNATTVETPNFSKRYEKKLPEIGMSSATQRGVASPSYHKYSYSSGQTHELPPKPLKNHESSQFGSTRAPASTTNTKAIKTKNNRRASDLSSNGHDERYLLKTDSGFMSETSTPNFRSAKRFVSTKPARLAPSKNLEHQASDSDLFTTNFIHNEKLKLRAILRNERYYNSDSDNLSSSSNSRVIKYNPKLSKYRPKVRFTENKNTNLNSDTHLSPDDSYSNDSSAWVPIKQSTRQNNKITGKSKSQSRSPPSDSEDSSWSYSSHVGSEKNSLMLLSQVLQSLDLEKTTNPDSKDSANDLNALSQSNEYTFLHEGTQDSDFIEKNLVFSPLGALVAQLTSELFNLIVASNPNQPTKNQGTLPSQISTPDRGQDFTQGAYKDKDLPKIPVEQQPLGLDEHGNEQNFGRLWIEEILSKTKQVSFIDEHNDQSIMSKLVIINDIGTFNKFFNVHYEISKNFREIDAEASKSFDNSYSWYNQPRLSISKKSSNVQRNGVNSDPIDPEDLAASHAFLLNNVRRSRTWNQSSTDILKSSSPEIDSDLQVAGSNSLAPELQLQSQVTPTGFRSRDPAAPNRIPGIFELASKNKTRLNRKFDSPATHAISPARVGLLRALGRRQSIRLEPNLGKIILAETRIKTGKDLDIDSSSNIHNLVKDDLSIALHLKNTPNLSNLSNTPKADKISYDRYLLDSVHTVDLVKLPPTKIFTTHKPKNTSNLAQLAKSCGGILYSSFDNSLVYSFLQNFIISEEKLYSLIAYNSEFYYYDYGSSSNITSKLRANSGILSNMKPELSRDGVKKQILDYYEKNFKTVELPPPVPLRVKRGSAIPRPSPIIVTCDSLYEHEGSRHAKLGRFYNTRLFDLDASLNTNATAEVKNSVVGVKAIIESNIAGFNRSMLQPRNAYNEKQDIKGLSGTELYETASPSSVRLGKQVDRRGPLNMSYSNFEGIGRVSPTTPVQSIKSHTQLSSLGGQGVSPSRNISSSMNRLTLTGKPGSFYLPNLNENQLATIRKSPVSSHQRVNLKKNPNNLTIDALTTKNKYGEVATMDDIAAKTIDSAVSSNYHINSEREGDVNSFEENERWRESKLKSPIKPHTDNRSSWGSFYNTPEGTNILQASYFNEPRKRERKLLLHGPVYKVMSALNAQTDAYIFLFSDVLVVTRSFMNPNTTGDSQHRNSSLLPFNPSKLIDEVPSRYTFNTIMVIPLAKKATSLSTTRNISLSMGSYGRKPRDNTLAQLEYDLRKIRRKFNDNPSGAIISLVDSQIITPQPNKLADFLIRTTQLNRQQLGKFICSGLLARELGNDATQDEIMRENKYYSSVWKLYLDRYNLGGIPLDEALRHILLDIKLPNDPMAINMLLEQFALNWYNRNRPLADAYQHLAKTHASQLISSYAEANPNSNSAIDNEPKIQHLLGSHMKKLATEAENDKSGYRGLPGSAKKRRSMIDIASAGLSNSFVNFIWVPPNFELAKRLVYALMTLNAELHNPLVCSEITPEAAFRELVKKFYIQLPANAPVSENLIPFSTESVYKSRSSANSSTIPPAILAPLDPNLKKETFLRKREQNVLVPYLEIPAQELYAIWERTRASKLQQASTSRNLDVVLDWDWVDYYSMYPTERPNSEDEKAVAKNFNVNTQLQPPFTVDTRKAQILLNCPRISDEDLARNFSYLNDIYSDPGFKNGLLFNASTDRIPNKMNVASPALMRVTISIPEPDSNYLVAIRVIGSSTSLQHLSSEAGYQEFSKGYIGDINKRSFANRLPPSGISASNATDHPDKSSSSYDIAALRRSLDLLTNDNTNPNAPVSVLPSDILSFANSKTAQFFIVPKSVGLVTIQFLAYGSRARYYSPLPARILTVEGGFMLHTLQLTWSKPNEQQVPTTKTNNPGALPTLTSPYSMPLAAQSGQSLANTSKGALKNMTADYRDAEVNLNSNINASKQPTQVRYMFGTTSEKSKSIWAKAIKSILKSNAMAFENSTDSNNNKRHVLGVEPTSPCTAGDVLNSYNDIFSANDLSDEVYKAILDSRKTASQGDNSFDNHTNSQLSKQHFLSGTELISAVLASESI